MSCHTKCDGCGDDIAHDKSFVVKIADISGRTERRMTNTPFGPAVEERPKVEDFDLCPSCGTAMFLAFKRTRLLILQGKNPKVRM
jgi:hypothetical protein